MIVPSSIVVVKPPLRPLKKSPVHPVSAKNKSKHVLKTMSYSRLNSSIPNTQPSQSDTPLDNSYSHIHSKFGKDPESKRKIMELLEAFESPNNFSFEAGCSPIPLRLEKIKKYINAPKGRVI